MIAARTRFALLAALLVFPVTPAVAGSAPAGVAAPTLDQRLAALEGHLEARRKLHHVPGAALLVVKGDRVVLMKGFGHRDADKQSPVTPDTLFAVGSTTKAFTALTAVLAEAEGKLSLDDRPGRHLPYFKLHDAEADAKATLRDLLSHRTGLGRTDLSLLASELTSEELVRIACAAKPQARFRERWQYNNHMYVAAGEAIARATGMPWRQYLTSRVLTPLGMTASTLDADVMAKRPDAALGYIYNAHTGVAERLPLRDIGNAAPAGALYSNLRDMSRWVRFLLGRGALEGRRLLDEKRFATLIEPHMPLGGGLQYGLGWILQEWQGKETFWHNGSIDGFNALVAVMPEENLGMVLLTNVSESPLEQEALQAVWEHMVGRVTPSAAPAEALKVDGHADWLGTYRHADSPFEVALVEEAGAVALSVKGQPPYKLIEDGQDRYRLGELPESFKLVVRRGPDGRPAGFVLEQPQGAMTFAARTPYQAPLTADALMARVIEAEGGEAALRRHTRLTRWINLAYEHQGVTSRAIARAEAPGKLALDETAWALGKRIGWARDVYDGTAGWTRSSFGPPERKAGPALANARLDADFYGSLSWKRLYKHLTITGTGKVGGEPVYVVVKTPHAGTPVTDHVSTTSFRVLKRDTTLMSNTSAVGLPASDTFSDFRTVEGVTMPFKIVRQHPSMGRVVMQVTRASFDEPIPAKTFLPD